jgi:hypothetical protein
MRIIGLTIALILLSACESQKTGVNQAGRFQQITNPHPPECGVNPANGCGLTILDTQTGTIFTREQSSWWEDSPQTGKLISRDIQFVPSKQSEQH